MGSSEHVGHSHHSSPTPVLPPAPDPSKDPGVVPSIRIPAAEGSDDGADLDIWTLTPMAALKMLCRNIDTLVRLTGDVPPTPPIRSSHKELGSGRGGLEKFGEQQQPQQQLAGNKENLTPQRSRSGDHIDGVPFVKTPIGSPESHTSEPMNIIGEHAEPIYIQHGALARKFYSKRPPPISTEEYLSRMHKYCPMSTAIYLATSLYINRLALTDRVVPVTPRNVHRLLLAGLRVAMKALEDLCWPHSRFSKVGGVTEIELGRLEIAFCFLINFELKVDAEMLQSEMESLRGGSAVHGSPESFEMTLPTSKGEKRKASSTLPSRPAVPIEVHAPS